jgi:hypothetical protein
MMQFELNLIQMNGKNRRLDKAAKQLEDLIETHLESLSPKDRERKERAFHNVVAKVGNRAKSSERPRTVESRRGVRRPA